MAWWLRKSFCIFYTTHEPIYTFFSSNWTTGRINIFSSNWTTGRINIFSSNWTTGPINIFSLNWTTGRIDNQETLDYAKPYLLRTQEIISFVKNVQILQYNLVFKSVLKTNILIIIGSEINIFEIDHICILYLCFYPLYMPFFFRYFAL